MAYTNTKEFVVTIENKPGTLADIATALGGAGVNITGFFCQAAGDFGIVRLLTSDPAKTESWLKASKYTWRWHDVLTGPVSNSPGELGRLTKALASGGVNIDACYPNVIPGQTTPSVAFCVSDLAAAKKILG